METLCSFAFDKTDLVSWNALNVLSFLKDYKPEIAVEHLIQKISEAQPKGGIAWVFGELGVKNEKVVSFLNKIVQDSDLCIPWWDAAFALKKTRNCK